MQMYVRCSSQYCYDSKGIQLSSKGCMLFWEYLMLTPSAKDFIKKEIKRKRAFLQKTQRTLENIVIHGYYMPDETISFYLTFFTVEGACFSSKKHKISLIFPSCYKKSKELKSHLVKEMLMYDANILFQMLSILTTLLFLFFLLIKEEFRISSPTILGTGCVPVTFIAANIYNFVRFRMRRNYAVVYLSSDNSEIDMRSLECADSMVKSKLIYNKDGK